MSDTILAEEIIEDLRPEELELLQKRALRYAKPQVADAEEVREAVFFARGARRYACPLHALREVRKIGKVRALPISSSIVPGVVHVRGELLSVHDLHAFITEDAAPKEGSFLLVIEEQKEKLALIADDIFDVGEYRPSALHPLPLTLGERTACFQGVFEDGTMLLLPAALFSTPAFSSI